MNAARFMGYKVKAPFLFWLLLCLAQVGSLLLLPDYFSTPSQAGALQSPAFLPMIHFSLIAISLTLALVSYLTGERDMIFLMACLVTAFTGVSAIIFTVLLGISRLFGRSFSLHNSSWLLLVGEDDSKSNSSGLHKQLLSRNAARSAFKKKEHLAQHRKLIVPLLDLLKFGSLKEKQRALVQIGRSFCPSFVSAMRAALQDSNNLVRVQAAATVGAIDARMLEHEFELVGNAAADRQDWSAVRKLAEHRARRARSGLLDSVSEYNTRDLALKDLERYVSHFSSDIEARIELARVLLEMKYWSRSVEALEAYIDRQGQQGETIREIYLKALFMKGDYSQLEEKLNSPLFQDRKFERIKQFWSSYGELESLSSAQVVQ